MPKNKKETQKITLEKLMNELDYLVAEGFVVYNPEDETYALAPGFDPSKETA
jgi:DNA-binding IclR family transcriptional regulator